MRTQERIRKLEGEVAALWQVVEDERLWHPTIIREILRRSRQARGDFARDHLRTAEEVFASLRRR